MPTEVKKPRPLALTPKELRADLQNEQARAARLAALLQRALVENEALKTSRDTALRLAAWGGYRKVKGTTRDEH